MARFLSRLKEAHCGHCGPESSPEDIQGHIAVLQEWLADAEKDGNAEFIAAAKHAIESMKQEMEHYN